VEFYEPLTWTAFHESIGQAHNLVASVTYPADLIILDKVGLPEGSALSQFRSAFQSQPINTGRVFVISKQTPVMMSFMGQLARVIQKLFPTKSKILFVSSLEQARRLASPIIRRRLEAILSSDHPGFDGISY
jgi:hypothetical protein